MPAKSLGNYNSSRAIELMIWAGCPVGSEKWARETIIGVLASGWKTYTFASTRYAAILGFGSSGIKS